MKGTSSKKALTYVAIALGLVIAAIAAGVVALSQSTAPLPPIVETARVDGRPGPTVPAGALTRDGAQEFVFKVVEEPIASSRLCTACHEPILRLGKTSVTVGAAKDARVQVLRGLAAGDLVALPGPTPLTDRMYTRPRQP